MNKAAPESFAISRLESSRCSRQWKNSINNMIISTALVIAVLATILTVPVISLVSGMRMRSALRRRGEMSMTVIAYGTVGGTTQRVAEILHSLGDKVTR